MTIYLSENIKRFRREKNLTQETLAEFLGVTFQSVSNWERGESYPDITILPEIASFFKVSIEELLGVNTAENEAEIKKLIEEHDNLTDDKLIKKSIYHLKDKYPNDFRVQLRYMGYLIFFDDATQNTKKIESLYQNIQNNCTKDSIRICAKRFYIHYLELLARDENSDVTFLDCEKIINEMPRMRDGREMYFNCYPENHPEKDYITQDAIEEEVFLLDNTLFHYYFDNEKFSLEQRIAFLEKTIEWFNFLYDDGNYSRMWRTTMYNYGNLGLLYFKKGDNEKALFNLRKRAKLAVKFDAMPKITTLQSTLFKGKLFDKAELGSTYIAKNQTKEHFTEKYPLSDEFKSTTEFKEILSMLD